MKPEEKRKICINCEGDKESPPLCDICDLRFFNDWLKRREDKDTQNGKEGSKNRF